MSDAILIIVIVIAMVAPAGLAIFLIKRETGKILNKKEDNSGIAGSFQLLKLDLDKIREEVQQTRERNSEDMKQMREKSIESLEKQLIENRNYTEKQLKESRQIVQDVTEKLTRLDDTNKQVIGFAEQLQSLENVLKNPKQRGNLGEYSLELLLEKTFTPKQYSRQYEFKGGDRVDFALFIGEKILPIDSKFSLENYNKILQEKDPNQKEQLEKLFKQDLKNRIDETSKYIRPGEGTFDFALMFIPAEGIYYDLLVNEIGAVKSNTRDFLDYGLEKHVHIVSPNSFYAMLQTILYGLKAFEIEKSAQGIREKVQVLQKHILNYEAFVQKLGNNLSATVNAYNTAYKELGKIDKDVVRIAGGEKQVEVLQIDKPTLD